MFLQTMGRFTGVAATSIALVFGMTTAAEAATDIVPRSEQPVTPVPTEPAEVPADDKQIEPGEEEPDAPADETVSPAETSDAPADETVSPAETSDVPAPEATADEPEVPVVTADASTAASPVCVSSEERRPGGSGYTDYRVKTECSVLVPHIAVRGVMPFGGEMDKHTDWITEAGRAYYSEWYSGMWGPPNPVRVEQRGNAAPRGTTCEVELEYDVTTPAGLEGVDRAKVRCSKLPVGVQVRIGVIRSGVKDTESEWTSVLNEWHTAGGVPMFEHYFVEYQADPAGVGSQCQASIVTTIERTAQYDQHAVDVSCSTIAPAIKVRGYADYTYQPDTYTDWFTKTGTTLRSPGQTRTVPAMPVAKLEYALRESSTPDIALTVAMVDGVADLRVTLPANATGTVVFSQQYPNGQITHRAAIIRDGVAQMRAMLPLGKNTFTASYSGDDGYSSATSNMVSAAR